MCSTWSSSYICRITAKQGAPRVNPGDHHDITGRGQPPLYLTWSLRTARPRDFPRKWVAPCLLRVLNGDFFSPPFTWGASGRCPHITCGGLLRRSRQVPQSSGKRQLPASLSSPCLRIQRRCSCGWDFRALLVSLRALFPFPVLQTAGYGSAREPCRDLLVALRRNPAAWASIRGDFR